MPTTDDTARKNRRLGLITAGVVVFMIALSFLSVPMYRLFCAATGLGGIAQQSAAAPGAPASTRTVDIRFNADIDRGLDWDFVPGDRALSLPVGQEGITSFSAKNNSPSPLTGTAIYSVLPEKAGRYFHKTQCFCFGEQTLAPGQSVIMPVLFYIDPEFLTDPNMRDITTITLSYKFYLAESDALTRALDSLAR